MQKLLLALIVGLGGFLGASLRYIISIFAAKNFGGTFPYGTLIANILGALLIGFIMEFSMDSVLISSNMKLFLTTGIMGGLTTFSTFSYETVSMLTSGNITLGIENITLNLGCSLLFVVIGQKLAKILF
ncbi:fluoride efflux transporter CrcB [Clostridium perfringens]|uniref:Fluoride-specific ion channel FluC n=1 Tax=Clostridium perfringens TaxID=1502 RepID=A0A127EHX8_CLOPF|nr:MULTISPECIES: fluoride efflux transporter CrcB [Clostridium]AMN35560.1 camphor resistance protein CrcB [Clostridium perfringens]EGT3605943.1 fluoride efflux transporter CrcB [Clostridium perfringens]EGT4139146.1 fluoride efflux transporter CrcB [Clostridium perfringens]EIW6613763.1 fluoride efflux transporter CrcB [Clostridium perfringens]EJT6170692.1 fluoride efflux transporter CrcB [Clostridium perfringens]